MIPHLSLNKQWNAWLYHKVHEAVASGFVCVKLLWDCHLNVSQLLFPSFQYCLEQYCTSYSTCNHFYLSFVYFIYRNFLFSIYSLVTLNQDHLFTYGIRTHLNI